MKPEPFKLERYFAKYEFTAKYILSASDCDGLSQRELLALADDQTREMWENLSLGYTESAGMPLLRAEIAGLYKGISPDDVLVITPEEGIFIAMNCLLGEGDHLIVTFPGYQSLYEIARSLGCEITYWQPDEEQGWRFDVDFLEKSIRPNTKLIVANFPHNPTGYLPPQADYQRIFEIADGRGIHVFSDEMFRYLELNPQRQLPSGCETYPQAVTLCGMSKSFGMAGVRIGWLVTGDRELYSRMAGFRDYTTICSSAPSEVLSLIALQNRDAIIGRHLARVQRNVGAFENFITRRKNLFRCVPPQGGTICFPRLLTGEDTSDFCDRVVRQTGIMIAPSAAFNYGNHHFRVGVCRENMPEVLAVLDDYLNQAHAYQRDPRPGPTD